MTEEIKLYSATDLAEKAGVSGSYVARLCRTGKLPAQKFGTVWLIREEDADAWLEKRSEHTDEN